jgi:hypothetical protein
MNNTRKFDKQRPGQPIAARTLNRPIEALQAMGALGVSAPLCMQSVNGIPTIRDSRSRPIDARITVVGTGGKYAWQGIVGATGGTWVDLPTDIAGTLTADPCYEANGNTAVAVATKVELHRDPATGEWRFWYDQC